MCGINGIVYFNKIDKQELQDKIGLMQKATKHRGSDQNDIFICDQAALSVNRLAIISPTERSTIQSMEENATYAIFNGEIVNHKELRKILKHPPTNQTSDTSIILPLFKEFGQGYIKKLAGMFAIAIYNQQKNELQLWRDPLGIKPLYYYHSEDHIIFSSEIKAIYSILKSVPEVDFAAVDHTLRYRFHPGRPTIFSEIKRVLPGETIIFKKNNTLHNQYWILASNKLTLDKDVKIGEFRKLLTQVIEENIQADVPGGFFVSGGLDSSLITSIALKEKSSYTQPISIRFLPQPVVDEEYGELLEKFLKTKFEWVIITDSIARKTLKKFISYIDEPLENPIHVGTYLMAKRARDLGIKSVLTGDGSDEFFLGYQRYLCWFNKIENPTVAYPKWLWTLTPEDASELYTDEAVKSVKPMVNAFNHKIEPFLDVNQALMFERLDRLSEYHNMRLDRMTMAHEVEARVPFLDHRIVEYALRIPLPILFGTSGKGWLQEIAKPWLPTAILNRPKVHFPSLPDQWLSGEGARWAAEILLDPEARIRKWIKQDVLERYIREHEKKIRKHGRLLWALIVLELWLKNLTNWR